MKKLVLLLTAASPLLLAVAHADPAVVVVANAAAPTLSKEQVADAYLGKNKSLKPVDLPSTVPAKVDFYQKVTGHDLAQIKATWARLTFTGQGQPPKELPDASAVKKAVAADPKTIGYMAKSDVDDSVKVILSLE